MTRRGETILLYVGLFLYMKTFLYYWMFLRTYESTNITKYKRPRSHYKIIFNYFVSMKSQRRTIIISIVIFLLGVLLIIGLYGWFLKKQERVQKGLARPSFPYSDYTSSEWNSMFPQYLNENVKTTQSPEETHTKFLSALKKGDFDGAVKCCILPSKQKEIKTLLDSVQQKGMVNLMISDLSEIEKEINLDSIMTYTYISKKNGNEYQNTIKFIKDQNGVWLIESL